MRRRPRRPEANGRVGDWNRIKRTEPVLGTLTSPRIRPNGRSSDVIAPSQANGCAMSCASCYVPRRKGYANPITVFANIEPEELLWRPETQEPKRWQTGGLNVRYRRGLKGARARELHRAPHTVAARALRVLTPRRGPPAHSATLCAAAANSTSERNSPTWRRSPTT